MEDRKRAMRDAFNVLTDILENESDSLEQVGLVETFVNEIWEYRQDVEKFKTYCMMSYIKTFFEKNNKYNNVIVIKQEGGSSVTVAITGDVPLFYICPEDKRVGKFTLSSMEAKLDEWVESKKKKIHELRELDKKYEEIFLSKSNMHLWVREISLTKRPVSMATIQKGREVIIQKREQISKDIGDLEVSLEKVCSEKRMFFKFVADIQNYLQDTLAQAGFSFEDRDIMYSNCFSDVPIAVLQYQQEVSDDNKPDIRRCEEWEQVEHIPER